jgi:hypothetical protein
MTYLEICFGCQKIFSNSEQFYFDTLKCDDMYMDLRGFFERRGFETRYKELSKELDLITKQDEKPTNRIPVDVNKIEKVEEVILAKLKASNKDLDLSRLRFSYPNEIYKKATFLTVTVHDQSRQRYFIVALPAYKLVEEVPLIRKLFK